MVQQQALRRNAAYPKRLDIFFHGIKTAKLLGALFRDRRIAVVRKVFFVLAVAALLVLLLFPDLLGELGLSAVLPILGTLLGIPIDAGFDWAAFALLVVSLLRIFPADLMAEHYDEIFRG